MKGGRPRERAETGQTLSPGAAAEPAQPFLPGIPRRPPGTESWGACAKLESMERAEVGSPRCRLLWGCGACNAQRMRVTTWPPRKGRGEGRVWGTEEQKDFPPKRPKTGSAAEKPSRDPHLPKRVVSQDGVLFADAGHGGSRRRGEGCLLLESLFNFLSGVTRSARQDGTPCPTHTT